jgi:signal transduction histidine kinase
VQKKAATPADTWSGESRRLRFADPALEAKFRDERDASGRLRARAITAAGMLVVVALGLNDTRLSGHLAPDYFLIALPLRLIVAAMWFVIFFLTFLPPNRRRSEWVNIVASVVACWALTLMTWHHTWVYPHNSWPQNLQTDLLAVLLISAFGLPFRFAHITAVAVAGLGGALLFCHLTMPPTQAYNLSLIDSGLIGIGLCTLVMSWWRESGDRAMFAQREHARQLADELAVSNAELARLTAEQAEFVAIAAHDLRAPLAVVRGLTDLIDLNRLNDDQRRQALQEIGRQTTRMLGLVTDYLGAHAAEGRAAEARLETTDLAAAAREAVARHGASAQAKHQVLTSLETERALTALADPAMLAQVLDNFVTNAIKFSPASSSIQLTARATAAGARLEVTDSGPGLAPEEQARLFRRFSRASTRPTAGESSHGLGLAVTRRLAEAMGGRVGCTSQPGAGATFWIELPAAAGGALPASAAGGTGS